MGDLTTEYYRHCASAEVWITEVAGSRPDTSYFVKWGSFHKNSDNVQYDWSCDCMAYKTRRGYCKHITSVISKGLRCGWMQFSNGGEPINDRCPKCGDTVHSMAWGV